VSLTQPLFLLVLLFSLSVPAIEANAAESSVRTLLLEVARRYGDRGAVSQLDIREDRPGRAAEEYRVEVWSRSGGQSETMEIFMLSPELRRGTAFRIHRYNHNGVAGETRHSYLPSRDRLVEIRGMKRRKMNRELGGLIGLTLMELQDDFEADDLGQSVCGGVRCRKIGVTTSKGTRFEIFVQAGRNPVIRRILRFKRGWSNAVQSLEVTKIARMGGFTVEAAGTMSSANEPSTSFTLRTLRRPNADERIVFTRDGFAGHARALAGKSAPASP
jgi:hypothetical protein